MRVYAIILIVNVYGVIGFGADNVMYGLCKHCDTHTVTDVWCSRTIYAHARAHVLIAVLPWEPAYACQMPALIGPWWRCQTVDLLPRSRTDELQVRLLWLAHECDDQCTWPDCAYQIPWPDMYMFSCAMAVAPLYLQTIMFIMHLR